jgi:NAD+ kinase
LDRIGLIPNLRKGRALETAARLIDLIEQLGRRPVLSPDVARRLGRADLGVEGPIGPIIEAAVVLGGDGTILSAAKPLSQHGTPILGINVGHLGFLAEVEVADMECAVQSLVAGDYWVEERMMLEARVSCGETEHRWIALNDVVVNRGSLARVVTLEAFVGEEWIEKFRGDGLIVATPTGSTAYSLAAGGPIISPAVSAMVVTPICPHRLTARAMVLEDAAKVRICVLASGEEVTLSVDGQVGHTLNPGDEVRVCRAPEVTKLVKVKERAFFRAVHSRMSRVAPF